jgi:hypothetical protein
MPYNENVLLTLAEGYIEAAFVWSLSFVTSLEKWCVSTKRKLTVFQMTRRQ